MLQMERSYTSGHNNKMKIIERPGNIPSKQQQQKKNYAKLDHRWFSFLLAFILNATEIVLSFSIYLIFFCTFCGFAIFSRH